MSLFRLTIISAAIVLILNANEIFHRPSEPSAPVAKRPAFEEIDLAALLQLKQRAKTVVVDARTDTLFERGHLQGAVSLPAAKLKKCDDSVLVKFKAANTVVVYCDQNTCMASAILAQYLVKNGVENVSVYGGGYSEWQACGLPVEISTTTL